MLVVVSALWKITDLILKVLNAARSGHEEEMQESLRQLSSRHEKVVSDSFEGDDLKEVAAEVKGCIQRLSEFSSAVLLLGSATAQVMDMALPLGEKMLPKIFAACLNQMGAKSEFVDSASVLTTDDKFGDASPDMESTRRRSREVLMPCLSQRRIPLVMGYTGATQTGQFTTLGRRGSDYSATILGAALDADEVWIWTDVDGVLTADPRVCEDATTLAEITFAEAVVLSYYGAKVIHGKRFDQRWNAAFRCGLRIPSSRKLGVRRSRNRCP